ncbi:MAG: glycosyltransferase family 2 protein [Candidatus Zixiibacteriota bacterium]|nr:MAG: glycosyltransferase family 2 protein [candidate division Zixibacteria bacterium]
MYKCSVSDHVSYSALVIIPAYNASEYLRELIERLTVYVCPENLLFIDDGSTDNSLDILRDRQVAHVHFASNAGKGAALMAGFRYALEKGYRSVLTIDADLQHLPEEIPRFYAEDDGHTLVIGTRSIKLPVMPFARCLTNYLTSLIVSVFSSQRVRDSQSGFRLIPTSLLRLLPLSTVGYDLESEMLFKAGLLGCRIREVPVSTVYEGSHSYISPIGDTLRFVRQIWRRIWA